MADVKISALPLASPLQAGDHFPVARGTATNHKSTVQQVMDLANTMARISGSTDSTMQAMQNLFHSSGVTRSGDVTDAGSNTIDVPTGTGLIRATDSDVAELLYFDWDEELGLSVPLDTTRYIGIQYNAGNPNVLVSSTNNFDATTTFHLATVVNEGGTMHINNSPHKVGDHASAMILRSHQAMGIQRDNVTGGLILGEKGTRNVEVSAGALWDRLSRFTISAIDTSVSDTYDRYFTTAPGVHTKQPAQTQWDNTQYNNVASGLVTLGANKYSNEWFYMELDGELLSMYGDQQFNSLAEAEDAQPPADVPDRIAELTILVGRIIFKKSEATADEIESAFDISFGGAVVSNHSSLANLSADDHLQYAPVDASRPFTGQPQAEGGTPGFRWYEPGADVNEKHFEIVVDDGDVKFRFRDDAETGTITGVTFLRNGLTWTEMILNSRLSMRQSVLFTKGLDVASASALPLLKDGNSVHITGTTDIDTMPDLHPGESGVLMSLVFDDILTINHDVTKIKMPGGVNLTTEAGDAGIFIQESATVWRCVSWTDSKSVVTPVKAETNTSYVPILTDNKKRITLNNAASIAVTIPANASVAFPIGTKIEFQQLGVGVVTVDIGGSDTLSVNGNLTKVSNGQFAVFEIYKRTATEWDIYGNLVAS